MNSPEFDSSAESSLLVRVAFAHRNSKALKLLLADPVSTSGLDDRSVRKLLTWVVHWGDREMLTTAVSQRGMRERDITRGTLEDIAEMLEWDSADREIWGIT